MIGSDSAIAETDSEQRHDDVPATADGHTKSTDASRYPDGWARAADPSAGGQRPGEDSWDWYQRSITALPPMSSFPLVPTVQPGIDGDW